MKPHYYATRLPGYTSWQNMKARCYNVNDAMYHRYGGRGIKVCVRWLESFENFLADVGPRPERHPSDGLYSIERIDNDGDYEPGNCRWATNLEQQNNRCNNRYLEYNGEVKTVRAWCEYYGITKSLFDGRRREGWSVERSLTTPVRAFQRFYKYNTR